jgi:hypothetical protein
MILPIMIPIAPQTMPVRRPHRSLTAAANGVVIIEPLVFKATSIPNERQCLEDPKMYVHGIEGCHDGDLPTGILAAHCCLKVRHDGDGTHERPIITVRTGTAESNEDAPCLVVRK